MGLIAAGIVAFLISLMAGGAFWAWKKQLYGCGKIQWKNNKPVNLKMQAGHRPVISRPISQEPHWEEQIFEQPQLDYNKQDQFQWRSQVSQRSQAEQHYYMQSAPHTRTFQPQFAPHISPIQPVHMNGRHMNYLYQQKKQDEVPFQTLPSAPALQQEPRQKMRKYPSTLSFSEEDCRSPVIDIDQSSQACGGPATKHSRARTRLVSELPTHSSSISSASGSPYSVSHAPIMDTRKAGQSTPNVSISEKIKLQEHDEQLEEIKF